MHPMLAERGEEREETEVEREGDGDQDVVLKDKMASLDNENKRVPLQRFQANLYI